MSVDKEVYLKNLRKYLNTSDDAKKLFLPNGVSIDTFMGEVERLSDINVSEGKDPQLTKGQYEDVRTNLLPDTSAPIFEMKGFPPIFLN